ncbi:hypothetical protein J1605_001385 [Eschrichtius robustus]|uniref:Uncharacterized protein n=1 Tax=Eschrichtius robustus TaxID=9764 RepID=A0AB34I5N6_ESCRO|nr:hypothetical protein J1605_001385 [Eschrichtius robustus]
MQLPQAPHTSPGSADSSHISASSSLSTQPLSALESTGVEGSDECQGHERQTEELFQIKGDQGFLGGAVVKNPPATARDTGSSTGPGRSHMPRSNEARVPKVLSLRYRAREPQNY